MAYIDGFVIPVPEGKKEAYLALAAKAAPIFKSYGALRVVECWGEDIPDKVPFDGKRMIIGGFDILLDTDAEGA